MNRPKVQMMGEISFLPQYSSNSTRVPSDFDWTVDETDIKMWMDNGIVQGAETPYEENKFGWILESRAIRPQLFLWFRQNYKTIVDRYECIFTCDHELISLDKKFKFVPAGSSLPWINPTDYSVYKKTKLCSMIASSKQMCPGHVFRQRMAEEMIKTKRVHVMGGACGTPKFGSESSHVHPDKLSGLKDYMFSIVMENESYDTYFTEKLTDCFATGTIPVYWGCPSIGKYFNQDGIIILTENFDISQLNADRYYDMIPSIEDNYKKIKTWMGSDNYLWETYLRRVYEKTGIL